VPGFKWATIRLPHHPRATFQRCFFGQFPNHPIKNLVDAFTGCARNRDNLFGACFLKLLCNIGHQLLVEEIALVESNDLGFFIEPCAISGKFITHGVPGLYRIIASRVDQVDQDTAAFDMAEEAIANSRAFGGTCDQTRNVGKDEFAPLVADHAELRARGGEGVGPDFRLGVGHLIDEGRFSGIGKANEPGVGEQFEPQPDPHFLAILTRLVLARCAVGTGLIACIAATTHPAFEEGDTLPHLCQVGQKRAFIIIGKDLRADRHFDHKIFTARAITITPGARRPARCLEMLGIAEIDQRVEASNSFENDVATLSAIAAIRAAIFDIFFAAKADSPGATGTGADIDFRLI